MSRKILLALAIFGFSFGALASEKTCDCYVHYKFFNDQGEFVDYLGQVSGVFKSFSCSRMGSEYAKNMAQEGWPRGPKFRTSVQNCQ